MLREDQKERLRALGEKQLAIAEKWEQEKDERDVHISAMVQAKLDGDIKAHEEAFDAYINVGTRQICEHDRSIWSPCSGCNEIEHALNPEFYDENGDRLEDDDIQAIVNANPEKYGIPNNVKE